MKSLQGVTLATVWFVLSCIVIASCGFLPKEYSYAPLYREYVFFKLSKNAGAVFYSLSGHPTCRSKFGTCIRRAECIEKKMLYLARSCYRRDMVCCYDDQFSGNDIQFAEDIIRQKVTTSTQPALRAAVTVGMTAKAGNVEALIQTSAAAAGVENVATEVSADSGTTLG